MRLFHADAVASGAPGPPPPRWGRPGAVATVLKLRKAFAIARGDVLTGRSVRLIVKVFGPFPERRTIGTKGGWFA